MNESELQTQHAQSLAAHVRKPIRSTKRLASQVAVSACFTSKRILPFGMAEKG